MRFNDDSQINFISTMAEHQISAKAIFNRALLDCLAENFALENTLLLCYDQKFNFLSWTTRKQMQLNTPKHPYHFFSKVDIVSSYINRESVKDNMSYTNLTPKVYKATDIIPEPKYGHSSYASFLQEHLNAKYSAIMPFGTNGFIHLVCLKTEQEGDFTEEEIRILRRIYILVAHTYKNFKKYEQSKIIREIQNLLIASGENAYIITDSQMHILAYNKNAMNYITELFGMDSMDEHFLNHCTWLPFLLEDTEIAPDEVKLKTIRKIQFRIHSYQQTYQHGIIEIYYWITMSKDSRNKSGSPSDHTDLLLTPSEKKVADLLCEGLTYQAIADSLFISYHTVKNHVQNIFSKYNVNSRYEFYKKYHQT